MGLLFIQPVVDFVAATGCFNFLHLDVGTIFGYFLSLQLIFY